MEETTREEIQLKETQKYEYINTDKMIWSYGGASIYFFLR